MSPYFSHEELQYQRKRQPNPPTPPEEFEVGALPSASFPSHTAIPIRNVARDAVTSLYRFDNTATPTVASTSILSNGLHVLHTASLALANLSQYYGTSTTTQESFTCAVETIVTRAGNGGKLVICGMGKSGRIGEKLVATFNSLGLVAVFLHPAEAVHGDVGMIKKNDTLLLLTQSGATPELLAVLPHLPLSCPRILLTSHTELSTCPLLQMDAQSQPGNEYQAKRRKQARLPTYILLPTPIPQSETASFGVPAPTTSISVALAVGHALAVAAGKEYYASGRGDIAEEEDDDEEDSDAEQAQHHELPSNGHAHNTETPLTLLPTSLTMDDAGFSSFVLSKSASRGLRKRGRRRRNLTVAEAFGKNHPGGALGAASAAAAAKVASAKASARMREVERRGMR